MTMLKEVKIELTNRCFRNCKHCSCSATNSSNYVKELDFEDVKNENILIKLGYNEVYKINNIDIIREYIIKNKDIFIDEFMF